MIPSKYRRDDNMSLLGDNTKQVQEAGNNAVQTQIGQQVNYYGASPSEVVKIAASVYTEMHSLALQNYADIATAIAKERVDALGENLFPRLEGIEGAMEHFKDPKFQILIKEAQISAIRSDRDEYLRMLSELLVCHIEKGDNRKVSAGITRAIRIVDEVDSDSLCALTIIYTLLNIFPVSGFITTGLSVMNSLFDSLKFTSLPKGDEWIDNLTVLGAINIRSGRFYDVNKIISERWDGYVCAGIPFDSDNYQKALSILSENGFDASAFVDNECMPGYKRLKTISRGRLLPQLHPIFDLYDKDKASIHTASNNFFKLWDEYETLKEIREWFEGIPVFFTINSVGKALAQTNGKRCYVGFPDLLH
ncbi:MAG: hypothetical protein IJK55_10840 [Bacteroidales bacterium]|nr:hypothetical protein [Bacteroidales bacterium]